MAIVTAVIDSREPEHIQKLTFGGVPTAVAALDYGDLHVLCDDDCTLVIERKCSDDLLGSMGSDRLINQMGRCAQARFDAQMSPSTMDSVWPYLIITGTMHPTPDGKTMSNRGVTGWNWASVMGELLSIQELGIGVIFCPDNDYEAAVIRLAGRDRRAQKQILPPKFPSILSPGHQVIASLPGIGLERLKIAMDYAGDLPGWALVGLTDPETEYKGIPKNVKKTIRAALKLKADERLEIVTIETKA